MRWYGRFVKQDLQNGISLSHRPIGNLLYALSYEDPIELVPLFRNNLNGEEILELAKLLIVIFLSLRLLFVIAFHPGIIHGEEVSNQLTCLRSVGFLTAC